MATSHRVVKSQFMSISQPVRAKLRRAGLGLRAVFGLKVVLRLRAVLVWFGLILVGSAAMMAPPSAHAQDGSNDEVVIQAKAGVADGLLVGLVDPIVVTLQSRRLIQGTLRVSLGFNGGSTVELPVEVPANTPVRVVMPVNGIVSVGQVRVNFEKGKKLLATTSVESPVLEGEAIAVLPGAQSKPFLRTADLGGMVQLHIVKAVADDFERFPNLLDSVSTLALRAEEFNSFSTRLQNDVLRWVRAGGEVLVDDKPGTPVNGLDALRPSDDSGNVANVTVGNGAFRFTSGEVRLGKWVTIAGFTRRGAYEAERGSNSDGLQGQLAFQSGQKVAKIGSLIIGLFGYIAFVGPFLFFLLRRTKRLVAVWTVIPLIASLTAAGVVGFGLSKRKTGTDAAVSVVDVGVGGARSVSTVLLRSVDGSTKRTPLKPEWHLTSSNFNGGGELGQNIERAGSNGEITSNIPAGGVILTSARGPLERSLDLTISAQIKKNLMFVSVKNPTQVVLRDVVVRSVTSEKEIGVLQPGATKTVSIEQAASAVDGLSLHERSVQPPVDDNGNINDNLSKDPDWTFFQGWNSIEGSPIPWGSVEVTGWAQDQPSPFVASARGWLAVNRRASLTPAKSGQRDAAEIRRIVRNIAGGVLARFDVNVAAREVIYEGEPAERWDGSTWVPIAPGPIAVPPSGMLLLRAVQQSWHPTMRTADGAKQTKAKGSVNLVPPPNLQIFSLPGASDEQNPDFVVAPDQITFDGNVAVDTSSLGGVAVATDAVATAAETTVLP